MAELKGSVLRGVFRDAKEIVPGGTERLKQALPQHIREAHFSSNIIHGSWYPYEAFSALLDAYAELPGNSRLEAFRRLGERMAERDFTTLLKVYAMVVSPRRLADVPRKVWEQRFRGAGSATCVVGERDFRFTISDFPSIHPMHCAIMVGYGEFAGRRNTKTFTSLHDQCVHSGSRVCSFLSQW